MILHEYFLDGLKHLKNGKRGYARFILLGLNCLDMIEECTQRHLHEIGHGDENTIVLKVMRIRGRTRMILDEAIQSRQRLIIWVVHFFTLMVDAGS